MPSNSSNLNSSIQNNLNKVLEKTIYLLVILSFRKSKWLLKLCAHNLFNNLIKIVKVKFRIDDWKACQIYFKYVSDWFFEKGNTNLNELITVQISLLFVSIMNAVPLQILNQHMESLFQIFVYLLKYLTQLEQQSKLF